MNSCITSEIVGGILRIEIVQNNGNEPKVSVIVTPESGRRLMYYGNMDGAKEVLSTMVIEGEKAIEWLVTKQAQNGQVKE